MRRAILPLVVLVMIAVIAAAFVLDCVRLATDSRHDVALADDEMHKHEDRLVKVLAASPKASPEVKAAIDKFHSADSPRVRHAAYEELVARFRNTMTDAIDPTNPLDRKFMDDIAGAINRREVAEKQYDEEFAIYKAFDDSFRGNVARRFLPDPGLEWHPGEPVPPDPER
jgi:Asp-tRNA(Asn)/Glu-tRNA(Gln) amidotransferase A subunit family amidase